MSSSRTTEVDRVVNLCRVPETLSICWQCTVCAKIVIKSHTTTSAEPSPRPPTTPCLIKTGATWTHPVLGRLPHYIDGGICNYQRMEMGARTSIQPALLPWKFSHGIDASGTRGCRNPVCMVLSPHLCSECVLFTDEPIEGPREEPESLVSNLVEKFQNQARLGFESKSECKDYRREDLGVKDEEDNTKLPNASIRRLLR